MKEIKVGLQLVMQFVCWNPHDFVPLIAYYTFLFVNFEHEGVYEVVKNKVVEFTVAVCRSNMVLSIAFKELLLN